MIAVDDRIALDERDITESFIRASGPGGQNVNKVSTAVQLRFDLRGFGSLPPPVCERLERLAGRRLAQDGSLIIVARRFRSQERNRADALARLVELVRRAAEPEKPRRATRPSAGQRQRRRDAKAHRAGIKLHRRPTAPD